MTHLHSGAHVDDDAASSNPAVHRAILAILAPFALATIVGLVLLWPTGNETQIEAADRVNGTVLDVHSCPEDVTQGSDVECRQATVRVDAGDDKGSEVDVMLPIGHNAPEFSEGDSVVLAAHPNAPPEDRYEIVDHQRDVPMIVLGVAFGLAVLALSRWRGLAALAGLGVSVLVLTMFVIPALLNGKPPLAVAVVGAAVIMFATLYLSHGISARTSVALLGTLVSLALTGAIGYAASTASNFTGLFSEGAQYLNSVADGVDVRGLLLAGIVIGALGVLDDVTITQSAAVWEIAAADPSANRAKLFAAGLRIGREHVAATVNTLVLAYAGAALPLLLLFSVSSQSVTDVVTNELIAQEVVRALTGSLGIVAAVPVTTAIAALAVRAGAPRQRGRRARRHTGHS